MPSPAITTALLAAVEPIAAYVARTPPPNRHADACATLVDAVADYVEETEAAELAHPAGPDWQAIALRMVDVLEFPPPTNPFILRVQRFLDTPAMRQRAALPLAQRLYLAQITSHRLGTPDSLLHDAD